MATGRYDHIATRLPGGRVLVAGGVGSSQRTRASAEIYDPASGTWAYTGSMADAREDHTATRLLDGRVLVEGGFGNPRRPLSSAEIYRPG